MRRLLPPLAVLILVITAPSALALTRVVETLPPVQGTVIVGACPFPVELTERSARTLVTFTNESGVVRQELSADQVTVFTNTTTGSQITLESTGTTTITPNLDGTSNVLQVGTNVLRGFTTDGAPVLVWVRGRVTYTGTLDLKTGLAVADAFSIQGQTIDLCDALITGILKSRH
jgi:hypothetical protein